jgi:hypothetical protein
MSAVDSNSVDQFKYVVGIFDPKRSAVNGSIGVSEFWAEIE